MVIRPTALKDPYSHCIDENLLQINFSETKIRWAKRLPLKTDMEKTISK